jgi:hypothetical protein
MILLVLANAAHTYIMIVPSDWWAQGSFFLIMGTMYHYVSAVSSALLLFDNELYLVTMKVFRKIMLILSYTTLFVFLIIIFYEIYISVAINPDWLILFIQAYIAYMIIALVTLMPSTLYIVIREASINSGSDPQYIIE